MLNNLKILLDKDYTPVKKATYYQLLDILFNMIIYTILFLTIYSLIEKSFTMNKIYWYSGFLLIPQPPKWLLKIRAISKNPEYQ